MDEPSGGAAGTADLEMPEEQLRDEQENVVPTFGYERGHVVGLGGSAGSIPALQAFFQAMPSDSGMAFVVVLHLSPEHESALAEVLQRSTPMPVRAIADGAELLPDHVYVIPPAKHVTIENRSLRLYNLPRETGRRMVVDLFFRSLADARGPHAIAVVLSGGEGDGAVGIKRIKERGGLTIAQDPEASEVSGMPMAAIATSMVDWVLRCEEMPARLLDYRARERRLRMPSERGPNPSTLTPPSTVSDETALRDVLTFLRARTGRDFSYYKRATIVRRVARRMQVNEVETLPAYFSFLRTHPGEATALLQDLLISVTNFFRDREAFEAIERLVPELFKNKTQSDTVRVWVPACATGEEAYSLAMLLSEYARTLDAPPALQIFATDLDEDVLAEARNGVYPEAISADVSPDRLRRFFIKEHHGYRVRRELREVLLFAVHDLLKDSPFSRLDMVSCRNLLIYLNRNAQQRVFDIFHFALKQDGVLFLGTSESVDDASQLFFALDKKNRIYASRPAIGRASLPEPAGPTTLARALALRDRAEAGGVTLATKAPQVSGNQGLGGLRLTQPERLSWSELHLKLIERFGPPSLIVNGEHDILHLSQGAVPFLQFAGGEPSTNLLRVVHPALRVELRAALFRARQTGAAVLTQNIAIELGGENRVVDLKVVPAAELSSDLSLVTFQIHDAGEALPMVPRDEDEPVLRHLERELEQTKRHLRDIVEQHEASTEELKASNEELQAMNEELRSATEELETSREELQSINEELTTVNQELKSKVEELGHANSDLHNLMGATAIATVFLDRDLRIMRFTPPAVDLFSLIPTDIGRPLGDLKHRLEYSELLADAARVLQQLVPIEREVPETGGRFFLARLLPYRTTEDRIAGVVLTFVDVTERQQAQEAVRRAQQELEARVQQRTAELDKANAALRQEVLAHEKAQISRRDLQRRLVTAQEEERSRLSRELHDEVGQQLSVLMLSLGSLETSVGDEKVLDRLRDLRGTVLRMGQDIHQLAYELRPIALDELGLPRALTGYLEGWTSRTGIPVDVVTAGIEDSRLPSAIETTIYRVIQEAMNNVYKHAEARRVSVSIERRGANVLCIVEDDGVGFEVADLDAPTPEPPRLGLAGMRERVAIVAGELTVASLPGSGTTIRARIPLQG